MKFFILLVLLFLTGFCGVFAQNEQTTITSLEVNGADYYDIEVMMLSDDKIYLPVKQQKFLIYRLK